MREVSPITTATVLDRGKNQRCSALVGASYRQQSGAVLAISLILLLVLTMVVLSANRGVVLQEKMTAAIRESNIVFQTAESALVDAESYIDQLADVSLFNTDGTGGQDNGSGLYAEGYGPANYLADTTWAEEKTIAAETGNDNFTARYFIQDLGEMPLEGQDADLSVNNNYNQTVVPPMARVFRVVVKAEGRGGAPVRLVSGYYSTDM